MIASTNINHKAQLWWQFPTKMLTNQIALTNYNNNIAIKIITLQYCYTTSMKNILKHICDEIINLIYHVYRVKQGRGCIHYYIG